MARKRSPGKKMAEKVLKMRKAFWPEVTEDILWNRKKRKGFTTIPRAMPFFMIIMDELSSGKPLSKTYFTLWCHVFDEPLIEIKNPISFAFESGFSGQRLVSTWTDRMRKLAELGFIKSKPGQYGEFSVILILNPYIIIKKLHDNGVHTSEDSYNGLLQRMIQIGATDLDIECNDM